MLAICETDCDLRDLTIGKKNVFIRWFSEPSETRPIDRLSLDGAVVAEIVYCLPFYPLHFQCLLCIMKWTVSSWACLLEMLSFYLWLHTIQVNVLMPLFLMLAYFTVFKSIFASYVFWDCVSFISTGQIFPSMQFSVNLCTFWDILNICTCLKCFSAVVFSYDIHMEWELILLRAQKSHLTNYFKD